MKHKISTIVEDQTVANADKLDVCSHQNQPQALAMPNTVMLSREQLVYTSAKSSNSTSTE